jgi:hypothetical protein
MTMPVASPSAHPRQWLRSTGAIVAGFIATAVLSLATDQLFHVLDVYPPWGQPMHEPGLNALALGYRILYGIMGGYITARLAPHSSVRHAVILGIIGFVVATVGAIGAITQYDLGPNWYPIALALTALPCTWLGGRLYEARTSR